MTPEQLKRRRLEIGLTQGALAEKIGVDITTVYRWESGLVEPSPRRLRSLRKALENTDYGISPFEEFLLEQGIPLGIVDLHCQYLAANERLAQLLGRDSRQICM